MDEQQKRTLAALYAHWDRRAQAVGPARAGSWRDMQRGLREAIDEMGYQIEPTKEFPHFALQEKGRTL